MASVVLSKKLNIFNIFDIENSLEPIVNEPEIYINAAYVEFCDYCGIQMLVSLVITAQKNGHSVFIESPSDVFIESVSTLGLEDVLTIER